MSGASLLGMLILGDGNCPPHPTHLHRREPDGVVP
jgi:hypothetical protein